MRTLLTEPCPPSTDIAVTRPRLGFLEPNGVARTSLNAILRSGRAEIAAIAAETSVDRESVAELESGVERVESLDELLEVGLDGVVIATPSAVNADQAIAALERGIAVFCLQRPGKDAAQMRRIIESARETDRLFSIDTPYRHLTGAQKIQDLCRRGDLGNLYALDLVIQHATQANEPFDRNCNGFGSPQEFQWLDLALWVLGFPGTKPVDGASRGPTLESGVALRLTGSGAHFYGTAGSLEASFHGTRGSAVLRSSHGSLNDFVAERIHGRQRAILSDRPENWRGSSILQWVRQLARGGGFSTDSESMITVANAFDWIHANHSTH
jgi:predicted dehydrogenase